MRTHALIGAAAGAAAFTTIALLAGDGGLTLTRLTLLGGALTAAALYDLAERRIPNRLVLPATLACGILALANGAGFTLLAGIGIVVVLVAVSLARPAALGMGDAKLALLITLGMDDGAARALTFGLALAALAGVTLVARRGRTALGASLPLAPFLGLGVLVALVAW